MNSILTMIDVISNEKNIGREQVFEALEEALANATRKKLNYDKHMVVEVVMDRNTGEYKTSLVEAIDIQDLLPEDITVPELTIADLTEDQIKRTPLENVGFNRTCANIAKQVIYQKVREAEAKKNLAEMQGKIGTLIRGVIKYAHNQGYTVQDHSNNNYFLPNSEVLNNEYFKVNDKVQAVLFDVTYEKNRNNCILSRKDDALLKELLRLEIPEIAEGVIQIKGIARQPGLRAKILVKSNDKRIDCVGACIGFKGLRAQLISNSLHGERLIIVEWHEEISQLIINVLAPVEISAININEDKLEAEIAVADEFYAQAIGKDGQNIQMANKLLGWRIGISTIEEMSAKQERCPDKQTSVLMEKLEIDAEAASILIENKYGTIELISYITDAKVIEGLAENIENIQEIITKSQEVLLLESFL